MAWVLTVRLVFRLSALATLMCLVCAGCGDSRRSDSDFQELIFCSDVDIVNVDPQVVSGKFERKLLSALFEGLVVPEPQTCQPLPGVAERWSLSDDGKVYNFYLRGDARWSNGDMVVADDFVFTARRALSSRIGCSFIEMFLPIKNARLFHEKKLKDFGKVGIHALDRHTLQIELEEPLNSFIYFLMQPCWYPLNDMVCESLKRCDSFSDSFFDIVSNGPFVITSKEMGRNVTVEKNPYYWDYDAFNLDRITFIIELNSMKHINMFKDGLVDISVCSTENAGQLSALFDKKYIKADPCFGCFYLICNAENKPLDDRNVRRALSVSIRRKTLLKMLSQSGDVAAYGLIPVMFLWDGTNSLFSEDPVLARKLLENAGYKDGKNFPKLRVVCLEGRDYGSICTFIKNEWKNVLNIDAEVCCVGRDELIALRQQGDFDICRGGWFGDYPDPMTFLNVFSGKSQQNHSNWRDAEYDRVLEMAVYAHSDAERIALLKRAEQILINHMPIIPLYFESSVYLVHDRVEGWGSNVLDIHPWKLIRIRNN
jgi:oligopeptide transport system substrate-binding protein